MSENQVVNKETGEVTEVPKQEEITTETDSKILDDIIKKTIEVGNKGLVLRSLEDVWRFAAYVLDSGMATKGDTRQTITVKIVMGMELGISPMQSIQNIAVINGRPSPWGDLVPGLIEASNLQEYGYSTKIGERNPDGSFPDSYGYRYTTKRKGRAEYSYEFTVADAKRAKLWGKTSSTGVPSPWVLYPDRMLLSRPRTFCIRDIYPDVMKGLVTAEEVLDIQDQTVEEPKSRTEKLVDLVKNQTKAPEQTPVATPKMTDLEKDTKEHLENAIKNQGVPMAEVKTEAPPEQSEPKPEKRGRQKKEQDKIQFPDDGIPF